MKSKTLDQLGSRAVKDQCTSEQTDDVNVASSCVKGKGTVQSNLGGNLTIEVLKLQQTYNWNFTARISTFLKFNKLYAGIQANITSEKSLVGSITLDVCSKTAPDGEVINYNVPTTEMIMIIPASHMRISGHLSTVLVGSMTQFLK